MVINSGSLGFIRPYYMIGIIAEWGTNPTVRDLTNTNSNSWNIKF